MARSDALSLRKSSKIIMASHIRTHLLLQLHPLEHSQAGWGSAGWQPPVDIYQLEDALLIQVEVPGLQIEDLQLHFQPGELLIEGRRARPTLPGPARALLVEMNYGPFRRAFALPANCDGDGIHATFEAGVLQIRVPLRKPAPPTNRRVEISS